MTIGRGRGREGNGDVIADSASVPHCSHSKGPSGPCLLGPVLPLLGELAGVGLLMLFAGAVTTHARKRDGLPELVPAVVSAALVAWYLVLLAGAGL
ncbi:DoxX family protein [Streptomyces sp. NPDC054783]